MENETPSSLEGDAEISVVKNALKRIMKKSLPSPAPNSPINAARRRNDGNLKGEQNETDDFVARLALEESEKGIFSKLFQQQTPTPDFLHKVFIQANVEHFIRFFFDKCFFSGLNDNKNQDPENKFSKQNFHCLEVIFEFPDYFSYWFRWISLFLVDEYCLKIIAKYGFCGMFWFVFSKTEIFPREIMHILLRFNHLTKIILFFSILWIFICFFHFF